MARGAGVDRAGALVPREVVDRQRLGVGFRYAAGDRTDQVHAPRRRRLDVLVTGVERVAQEFLGQPRALLQLVEHRHHRRRVRLRTRSAAARR